MQAQKTYKETFLAAQRQADASWVLMTVSFVAPWLSFVLMLAVLWSPFQDWAPVPFVLGTIITVLAWLASIGFAYSAAKKARLTGNDRLRRSAIGIYIVSIVTLLVMSMMVCSIALQFWDHPVWNYLQQEWLSGY